MIDGMKHHFAWKAECRKKFQVEIGKSIVTVFNNEMPGSPQPEPSPVPHSSDDEAIIEDELDVGMALSLDKHVCDHQQWRMLHLNSNPNEHR
jgi:hypothetical protein